MTPLEQLRSILGRRASYYRSLFTTDRADAKEGLMDLAYFCRANESTFHPDARIQAMLEGRREVWLRIQNYSRLNTEDLLILRLDALKAKKNPAG